MPYALRPMREDDWQAVAAIHQEGIDTGHATFALRPAPSWQVWAAGHLNELSEVAVENAGDDARIAGWIAVSPTSTRHVYRGVVELSLYIGRAARGRGVGTLLLESLIRRSEAAGIWTLQAGIFPENAASIHLHHALGFRTVGILERAGYMHLGPMAGKWRDVALLQRRSTVAGILPDAPE